MLLWHHLRFQDLFSQTFLFREVPALAPVQQMGWILPVIVAVISTVFALLWFVGKAMLLDRRRIIK